MTATTTLGTPASPKWDDDWLAHVDRVEQELGHRICGAHTPAWTPCKLTSTHPNGRCRFHGGAAGIGAPNGNRNAWVHGLYSRRLQQCGDHCPLWNHCPMAGNDVLKLHPAERPHCVYEQEEYDATTSILQSLSPTGNPNVVIARSEVATKQSLPGDSALTPPDAPEPTPSDGSEPGLIERNVALFQVMLTRAQAALRVNRLTDESYAQSKDYESRSTRVSALLTAQLQIARELRQWLKLLPGFDPRAKAKLEAANPPPQPPDIFERIQEILKETDGILEQSLEYVDDSDDDYLNEEELNEADSDPAAVAPEPV